MVDTQAEPPAAAAAAPTDGGQASDAATSSTPAAGVKRKRYTLDLNAITLDPHYDLTLIVGTPEHKDGQKGFRVSKSSMRHVSDVWTKMLTGDWIESNMTEIEFPDDSWKAVHIVLKIAHLQFDELPDALSIKDLLELATLTDKYNLTKAVRMGLEFKQWLHQHKDSWTTWPSLPCTQHFAIMTSVFQYGSDLTFIISKLAVEASVNANELCFYGESSNEPTRLMSNLPVRIIGRLPNDMS